MIGTPISEWLQHVENCIIPVGFLPGKQTHLSYMPKVLWQSSCISRLTIAVIPEQYNNGMTRDLYSNLFTFFNFSIETQGWTAPAFAYMFSTVFAEYVLPIEMWISIPILLLLIVIFVILRLELHVYHDGFIWMQNKLYIYKYKTYIFHIRLLQFFMASINLGHLGNQSNYSYYIHWIWQVANLSRRGEQVLACTVSIKNLM